MEGTLPPRGAEAPIPAGFYEQPGGGKLSLGRPRYLMRVAVVGATFAVLGSLMILLTVVYGPIMNPGGSLGILLSGIMFYGFAAVFFIAIFMNSGVWLLGADERGVHLGRPHRRPKELAWASMKRIQYGPTAISMGRSGARLGDAIRIESHHRGGPILLDTVRFAVAADDMDRMALVLRDLGRRQGVPVEPFPMAGRESR